jgi:hypothetical protein
MEKTNWVVVILGCLIFGLISAGGQATSFLHAGLNPIEGFIVGLLGGTLGAFGFWLGAIGIFRLLKNREEKTQTEQKRKMR